MKRLLILVILVSLKVVTYGQHTWYGDYCIGGYKFDFENTACHNQFVIDTINPENIWQIGSPRKQILNSSKSSPNVIITDTVNSYPANNYSHFLIKHIEMGGYTHYHTATLSGFYKVDSDSINDYGTIEFSGDNGITWVDIVNDTLITENYVHWERSEVPILTGNSGDWKYFHVYLMGLAEYYNINENDTLLFRFSFVSDSIDSEKDGLMYDDLLFIDYYESVDKQHEIALNLFPNPTTAILNIKTQDFLGCDCIINIYSSSGTLFDHHKRFITNTIEVDVSGYTPGHYILEIVDSMNQRKSVAQFEKIE